MGHDSQYVFDPVVMQRIARQAVAEGAGDADAAVAATVRLLRQEYPKCAPTEAPRHMRRRRPPCAAAEARSAPKEPRWHTLRPQRAQATRAASPRRPLPPNALRHNA